MRFRLQLDPARLERHRNMAEGMAADATQSQAHSP